MTAGFATAIDGAANVFLDAASAYDWPAPTARAFARLSAAAMGRGMTPAIARLSASHRVR